MRFAATFVFSRPTVAPYRRRDGGPAQAGVDAPCFDHDAGGQARGLLVEPREAFGQHDAVRLRAPVMPAGPATVFHARTGTGGSIERRAHYSVDATRTIDALLLQVGPHRLVGAVAGFVPVRRGAVHYRNAVWATSGVVALPDGTVIGLAAALALLAG